MKQFIAVLFFLFASVVLKIYGQTTDTIYKSISDSTFEIGDRIIAPKIIFSQAGGARILPESYDSVEIISTFLKKHPNISIEIGGHTDSRGSLEFNLDLL